MNIDFASLAFGYSIKKGGATPNWATSLGQGKEYKIMDNPEIDELLKGLVYSSVPLSKIECKIGKGGKITSGHSIDSPILVAAFFEKVYINDKLIIDGKYIILITKDTSKSHAGRLRFKYGPSNTYEYMNSKYSNDSFWTQAKKQLKFDNEACFFVYNISVENQNILKLNTIIVNSEKSMEYEDSADLHNSWKNLIQEEAKVKSKLDSAKSIEDTSQIIEDKSLNLKTCLEINRKPNTKNIFPLNFIVYGAPGTGKTYSMVDYALAIINDIPFDEFIKNNLDRKINIENYKNLVKSGQIVFTTFHQNYGYEEFIQGVRPDKDSESLKFKTIDGIFKIIADKALNDIEGKNYVIIIDEINRANISRVFGELITLIEEDKRWGEINETSVTLQSGDSFAVPNNLYIIGTMNSADKSISLIDAALRRRFDFIEKRPNTNLVSNSNFKNILDTINQDLVKELDNTDLVIGPSYFMNKHEKDLCNILNNKIIPLLYEYFYDNRKKIAKILNNALNKSTTEIKIIDDKVGRLRVKE